MANVDLSTIRAISFDCYGTLVDWESGIAAAMEPVFAVHHVDFDRAKVMAAFARHERQAESGPFSNYAAVLGRVMQAISDEFDLELNRVEATVLADSVRQWPVFAETPKCLKALQHRYKLAVFSNVDDDLFAKTATHLGVNIGVVVTAEQVKSYKPGRAHFEEGLRRLMLKPQQVLHVAESRFHDIEPASSLGFPTVWVNRRGTSGAPTASGLGAGKPNWEVGSLTELCELLDVKV